MKSGPDGFAGLEVIVVSGGVKLLKQGLFNKLNILFMPSETDIDDKETSSSAASINDCFISSLVSFGH